MNHKGTVEIETPHLLLRRITMEDAPAIFENWASDDEVTRYLTWPTHQTVRDSEGFITFLEGLYTSPDAYQWGIVLKENGKLIGNISVVRMDEIIESVDLGWVLGRSYWGQGIMPEAAKAVRDFLFDEVGVHRVAARHDVRNQKSGRVMQKIGMKFEGTLRAAGKNNQGICDISCYSILKEDTRV